MTLTKQQKLDMIRDVELRLAKEELAEQYLKNVQAIENSDKPLRTLQGIVDKNTPSDQENVAPKKESVIAGHELVNLHRQQWHDITKDYYNDVSRTNLRYHDGFISKDTMLNEFQIFTFAHSMQTSVLAKQQAKELEQVKLSDKPLETEQAIISEYDVNPDLLQQMKAKLDHQSKEDKELLKQSGIAVKTPFKKDDLDSKTQREFIGLETQTMRDAGKQDINMQEHFENAQTMSADHDMGMER